MFVLFTWYSDFDLAALAESAFNGPFFSCRQCNFQSHEELKVGLLFKEVSTNQSVVIGHLTKDNKLVKWFENQIKHDITVIVQIK